jgi:gliding motility-associated lipoprotein GldB
MKKKFNFAQSIKMMAIHSKTKQIYSIFFIGILLAGCGRNKKLDVSHINVNITIERLDKDLDAMRTKPMAAEAPVLEQKYGAFYQDFLNLILETDNTNVNDTTYFKTLHDVLNGRPYMDLKHDVDSVYPNLDAQNAGLTDAFRRIKYYFPNQKLPRVYAYFSGFATQISVGDDYIAFGLDLFLGANSRFYPALTKAYPHYLSRSFTPGNIVPRVVENFVREDMFTENDDNQSLLNKMIYNGKIMYLMDQVLPDVPDTTKIGYTTAQLKWCNDNEDNIWGYFLDQNLLYETDWDKIQKFLSVAPFTPGLGENNESAPKLGVWEGWQIVRQYMAKNPNVTLPQLMANTDAEKILSDSRYHPK